MLTLFNKGMATSGLAKAVRAFSSIDLEVPLRTRIEGYIANDPVVVFMKGTQQEPMCGFSKRVKLILDFHEVKFKDYNVLEDNELREGIKKFSDWPTIPQVYVKGEFVGGSDILYQMHQDGEITDFFDKAGIRTKYTEKIKENEINKEK